MTRAFSLPIPMTLLLATLLWSSACLKSQPQTDAPAAAPLYGWVAMGPQDQIVVRVVTAPDAPAPELTVDGRPAPLKRRADKRPAKFAVDVWEAHLPMGVGDIRLGDRPLKAPTRDPQRIVIMGDTGCRVKLKMQQDCNGHGTGDPWMFAELAEVAASMNPDLVVHVGDYLYREYECTKNPGCKGSPYGDTFDTWRADFLEPAGQLLAQFPWVFARGNHENCKRGHHGWFYLLDPAPPHPAGLDHCEPHTPPYSIPLVNRNLLVMDNAQVPYETTPKERAHVVEVFAEQFKNVNQLAEVAQQPSWLIAHRPIWSIVGFTENQQFKFSVNDTILQDALAMGPRQLDPTIELLLGGHLHLFESLHFDDGRPPQFVSGGGGTSLDPEFTREQVESQSHLFEDLNLDPADFRTEHAYNFIMLDRNQGGWTLRVFGLDGQIGAAYQLPDHTVCANHNDTHALLTQPYLACTPVGAPVTCTNPVEAALVQDRFVAGLTTQLGKPVGYKAALTSPPARARFGVDQPLWGVLLEKMLYPSGAELSTSVGARPLLEGDLMVRIGDEAINQATTRQQAASAVDAVFPFLELPDLVYAPDVPLNGPAITAINTGARAGVLGQAIVPGDDAVERLGAFTVELLGPDGAQMAVGKGANLMGHPLDALLWMRDALHKAGRRLKKGDLVSLGSLTPPGPLNQAGKITARYHGLAPEPVEVVVILKP